GEHLPLHRLPPALLTRETHPVDHPLPIHLASDRSLPRPSLRAHPAGGDVAREQVHLILARQVTLEVPVCLVERAADLRRWRGIRLPGRSGPKRLQELHCLPDRLRGGLRSLAGVLQHALPTLQPEGRRVLRGRDIVTGPGGSTPPPGGEPSLEG